MEMSKCLPKPPCTGVVRVKNILGEYTLPCSTALESLIGLPSNIEYGSCSETLTNVHPCGGDNLKFNCGGTLTTVVLLALLVFGMTSTVSVMMIRWNRIKMDLKSLGLKLRRSGTRLNARDIKTREIIKSYKLSKMMLYLLFGTSLPSASACIRSNGGLHEITQGSTLCTNRGNYTLSSVSTDMILNLEYYTSDWTASYDTDWGCAGGSCPYLEDCANMSLSDPVYSGPNSNYSKTFCHNYPGACAFGRGCRYGVSNLHIKPDIYRSYTIEQLSLHIGMSREGSCKVVSEELPGILVGSHTILMGGLKKYICPLPNYRGTPTMHELGDLQFKLRWNVHDTSEIETKSIAFDWRSLTCRHKWYDGTCLVPMSFMSQIDYTCYPIPGPYAGGYLTASQNRLLFHTGKSIMASITCSNETIIESNVHCQLISFELWGIRSHGTGVYLVIRFGSGNSFQDTIMENPCFPGTNITVPCDGQAHYYPVSEDISDSCKNIEDKTLTDYQAYLTGNYKVSGWQGTPVFGSVYHTIAASLIGGWFLVFLIIAILLCCRK